MLKQIIFLFNKIAKNEKETFLQGPLPVCLKMRQQAKSQKMQSNILCFNKHTNTLIFGYVVEPCFSVLNGADQVSQIKFVHGELPKGHCIMSHSCSQKGPVEEQQADRGWAFV